MTLLVVQLLSWLEERKFPSCLLHWSDRAQLIFRICIQHGNNNRCNRTRQEASALFLAWERIKGRNVNYEVMSEKALGKYFTQIKGNFRNALHNNDKTLLKGIKCCRDYWEYQITPKGLGLYERICSKKFENVDYNNQVEEQNATEGEGDPTEEQNATEGEGDPTAAETVSNLDCSQNSEEKIEELFLAPNESFLTKEGLKVVKLIYGDCEYSIFVDFSDLPPEKQILEIDLSTLFSIPKGYFATIDFSQLPPGTWMVQHDLSTILSVPIVPTEPVKDMDCTEQHSSHSTEETMSFQFQNDPESPPQLSAEELESALLSLAVEPGVAEDGLSDKMDSHLEDYLDFDSWEPMMEEMDSHLEDYLDFDLWEPMTPDNHLFNLVT